MPIYGTQRPIPTFGTGGGFNRIGGQTGVMPRPKTGYTIGGEPTQVEPTRDLPEYDPNVSYAGTGQVFASNPLQTISTLQAAQNLRAGDRALQGLQAQGSSLRVSGQGPQGSMDPQQQLALDRQRLQMQQEMAEQALRTRMGFAEQLMGRMPQQVDLGQFTGNEDAARAAAFARAKEQAGQTALSALKSLQGMAEERGLMGSSVEGQMIGDVMSGAVGQVDDFTREQLIQDLENAAQRRNLQYQGGITQRGQNIAMMPSLLGLLQGGGGLY